MQTLTLLCIAASLACETSGASARAGDPDRSQYLAASAAAESVIAANPLPPVAPVTSARADIEAPELPRILLDTRYVPPTGRRVRVGKGDNLQRAIERAERGDVLLLEPGATFIGPFTLPPKKGNGWIVIRSAADDADLPPEGQRATPAFARAMPKLVSKGDNRSVLLTAAGASRWRLIGLEITTEPEVASLNALVRLGDAATDQGSDTPTDIILDRLYVHGQPKLSLQRCVLLNSARSSIIDSHLSDCHAEGFDSQAIVGWNGPGPFKIVNNYLEGAGEIVMFGGAKPETPDLVPSDIEIRRNHFHKPASWVDSRWTIKNIFELKFARRVLFEGNVLDGNWRQAQTGYAMVLKSSASVPWAVTEDVTIRFNRIRNVGSGFALNGKEGAPIQAARRIAIVDNVLENVNVPPYRGDGRLVLAANGLADIIIDHNTMLSSGAINAMIAMDSPPAVRGFSFRNNIVMRGNYGVKGGGAGEGAPTLARHAPGAIFTGNVIIGRAAPYPSGNSFVPSIASVGFHEARRADWRLAPSGAFRRGDRLVGANVAAVDSLTAGVVVR